MTAPLDDLYLPWLYSQVGARSVRESDPSRTHWTLLRQLYSKKFVWFIPNDDNRVEDGLDLRHEFISEKRIFVDPDWMDLDCSLLELLIGLARRLAFEAEGHPHVWFWHLIDNLELTQCTDARRYSKRRADEILDNVIWRLYDPDGRGGLFPLKNPHGDQREVELWYQMQAYLLDG